jgi:gp32 DNA binding protein like
MAINLEAIKQKLNSLQTVTSKSNNLWKPEPGTTVVRIVPYQHNRENPFLELYFHYNFGGKSILSPSSFGRPDPIMEFAEKLKSTGNSDDWKAGKKLEPTMRCYVPVLIRGKESEGVKFWGFGKQVYQELLGFIADPDYGDISDPTAGRDVTVEFKTKDQTGKDFPETSIRVKPNQTPITTDKNVLDKLKNQPKVTEIFKEHSYEEMTKMLHNWLDPENAASAESTDEAATEKKSSGKGGNKAKIEESAPVAKVDDVASAFDSLFNK